MQLEEKIKRAYLLYKKQMEKEMDNYKRRTELIRKNIKRIQEKCQHKNIRDVGQFYSQCQDCGREF